MGLLRCTSLPRTSSLLTIVLLSIGILEKHSVSGATLRNYQTVTLNNDIAHDEKQGYGYKPSHKPGASPGRRPNPQPPHNSNQLQHQQNQVVLDMQLTGNAQPSHYDQSLLLELGASVMPNMGGTPIQSSTFFAPSKPQISAQPYQQPNPPSFQSAPPPSNPQNGSSQAPAYSQTPPQQSSPTSQVPVSQTPPQQPLTSSQVPVPQAPPQQPLTSSQVPVPQAPPQRPSSPSQVEHSSAQQQSSSHQEAPPLVPEQSVIPSAAAPPPPAQPQVEASSIPQAPAPSQTYFQATQDTLTAPSPTQQTPAAPPQPSVAHQPASPPQQAEQASAILSHSSSNPQHSSSHLQQTSSQSLQSSTHQQTPPQHQELIISQQQNIAKPPQEQHAPPQQEPVPVWEQPLVPEPQPQLELLQESSSLNSEVIPESEQTLSSSDNPAIDEPTFSAPEESSQQPNIAIIPAPVSSVPDVSQEEVPEAQTNPGQSFLLIPQISSLSGQGSSASIFDKPHLNGGSILSNTLSVFNQAQNQEPQELSSENNQELAPPPTLLGTTAGWTPLVNYDGPTMIMDTALSISSAAAVSSTHMEALALSGDPENPAVAELSLGSNANHELTGNTVQESSGSESGWQNSEGHIDGGSSQMYEIAAMGDQNEVMVSGQSDSEATGTVLQQSLSDTVNNDGSESLENLQAEHEPNLQQFEVDPIQQQIQPQEVEPVHVVSVEVASEQLNSPQQVEAVESIEIEQIQSQEVEHVNVQPELVETEEFSQPQPVELETLEIQTVELSPDLQPVQALETEELSHLEAVEVDPLATQPVDISPPLQTDQHLETEQVSQLPVAVSPPSQHDENLETEQSSQPQSVVEEPILLQPVENSPPSESDQHLETEPLSQPQPVESEPLPTQTIENPPPLQSEQVPSFPSIDIPSQEVQQSEAIVVMPTSEEIPAVAETVPQFAEPEVVMAPVVMAPSPVMAPELAPAPSVDVVTSNSQNILQQVIEQQNQVQSPVLSTPETSSFSPSIVPQATSVSYSDPQGVSLSSTSHNSASAANGHSGSSMTIVSKPKEERTSRMDISTVLRHQMSHVPEVEILLTEQDGLHAAVFQ